MLLLFFAACLAFALDRALSLKQPHHTAWLTRDGAPAQVEWLAQTDDGHLASGDPTRVAVEGPGDRAEAVVLEGRNSVSGLRAPVDAREKLGETLARCEEELAREHRDAFGASVDAAGTGTQLSGRLRHEIEHTGREALLNASQHACATSVQLMVRQTPTRLVLEVVDDGRGMSTVREGRASGTGHWGLAGMRERAGAIDARLTIDSAVGDGTQVRLELPLRGNACGGSRRLPAILPKRSTT